MAALADTALHHQLEYVLCCIEHRRSIFESKHHTRTLSQDQWPQ